MKSFSGAWFLVQIILAADIIINLACTDTQKIRFIHPRRANKANFR